MADRVVSSKPIFEGEVLRLRVDEVEAPDGHRGTREVIEHGGAVGVVVVHEGQVVLVRQYRHAAGETLLEIPAGRLATDEDPDACAKRELAEEIGLHPLDLTHLRTFYTTPGFSNELFHLYLSTRHEETQASLDPGEILTVERVPMDEVRTLLFSGAIKDAKTLVGLSLLLLR